MIVNQAYLQQMQKKFVQFFNQKAAQHSDLEIRDMTEHLDAFFQAIQSNVVPIERSKVRRAS